MTQTSAATTPAETGGAPSAGGGKQPEIDSANRWSLPRLRTGRSREEVIATLDRAARQGKLPGFETEPPGDFRVAAFGSPFDRELVAEVSEREGGSEIRFSPRLLRKAPAVLIASVVVSIWPGVEFVDALIPASWGWWPTWTWYLPLVIVPTALMIPGLWRKSEDASAAHAREQIEKIGNRLGAETLPAGSSEG